MKRKDTEREQSETRVELKYCERCGGLWLREYGSGEIYCHNCLPQVAELPITNKLHEHLRLPVGPSVWEDNWKDLDEDDLGPDFDGDDLDAFAGGVA